MLIWCPAAQAGPTWVGNADDGSDLEGAKRVESGVLIDSRKTALMLLKTLGTEGVPGLGTLSAEVESSHVYMAAKDVSPLDEDQGSFHSDLSGRVYARTHARPHAPTRFFPIAATLSEAQLISLHIHEALHRSLPEVVRENESKVASITLAITSPEATQDQVRSVIAVQAPEILDVIRSQQAATEPALVSAVPESSRVKRPSVLAYGYRNYRGVNAQSVMQVESLHSIQSFLYPFGGERTPLGIGLEATLLNKRPGTEMGPLGLSARLRLWSSRGYDVGAFAKASLNMLSKEELQNSAVARDVGTFGVSMRKDLSFFFVENELSASLPGKSQEMVGTIPINYEFGTIYTAKVRAGGQLLGLKLGGFVEVNLADYFRVKQSNFTYDPGRYRIISGGPEVTYDFKNFGVSVYGRYLMDSTKGADFDWLGNILGQGMGQGSLGAEMHVYF